jgi:hypothetical protein
MQSDRPKKATDAGAADAEPAADARAAAFRERFRQSQAIAAQVARARAAGGAPSESDAARLIAEFHANGGKVTICPPASDAEAAGGSAGSGAERSAAASGRSPPDEA